MKQTLETIETLIDVMSGRYTEKPDPDREIRDALKYCITHTYAQSSLVKKVFYKNLEKMSAERAKESTMQVFENEVVTVDRQYERIRFKVRLRTWYNN